jgi:hypothetical protein
MTAILLNLVPLYFLPSLIGWWRGIDRPLDLFVINLGLGWLVLPWVFCLGVAIGA